MRFFILAFFCFWSVGCVSYRVSFDPRYVPPSSFAIQPVAKGKGLIFMDPADESFVYTGRPSSFTGGGTTLVIPLGSIIKEISTKRMSKLFSDGADYSTNREKSKDYENIVQTRAVSFSYKYNRMRNLDFATTPQIDLVIQVSAFDSHGNMFFSKTYGTGTFSGKTVLDTVKPAELINRIAHEAAAQLLEQAAVELESVLKTRQSARFEQPLKQVGKDTSDGPIKNGEENKEIGEERLKKLKALHEQGLISKEVYEQKQKEILSSF